MFVNFISCSRINIMSASKVVVQIEFISGVGGKPVCNAHHCHRFQGTKRTPHCHGAYFVFRLGELKIKICMLYGKRRIQIMGG